MSVSVRRSRLWGSRIRSLCGDAFDVWAQLDLCADDVVRDEPAEDLLPMLIEVSAIWLRGAVLCFGIWMRLRIELVGLLLVHA